MGMQLDRPSWILAGLALGLIVIALQWLANLPLGVTGAVGGLTEWLRQPKSRPGWRVFFFFGIIAGAFVFQVLTAGFDPHLSHGAFDYRFSDEIAVKAPVLMAAGLLIGFGARWAGGCTSGNGICGVSRMSRTSLLATLTFTLTAMAVIQLIVFLRGGR